jgi:hypothetical protein
MFTVHLTNFGYDRAFPTENDAIQFMKKAGFESTLWHDGKLMAKFDSISQTTVKY